MNVACSERSFITSWSWDQIFLGNTYSLAGLPLELLVFFKLLVIHLWMTQKLGLKFVVWSILVFFHQSLLNIGRTYLVMQNLRIYSFQIRLKILIFSIKWEIINHIFLFSSCGIFGSYSEIRLRRINFIFDSNLTKRRLGLRVQLRRWCVTIFHDNYFIFQCNLVHVLHIVV